MQPMASQNNPINERVKTPEAKVMMQSHRNILFAPLARKKVKTNSTKITYRAFTIISFA
jgi:hypothetical protein